MLRRRFDPTVHDALVAAGYLDPGGRLVAALLVNTPRRSRSYADGSRPSLSPPEPMHGRVARLLLVALAVAALAAAGILADLALLGYADSRTDPVGKLTPSPT